MRDVQPTSHTFAATARKRGSRVLPGALAAALALEGTCGTETTRAPGPSALPVRAPLSRLFPTSLSGLPTWAPGGTRSLLQASIASIGGVQPTALAPVVGAPGRFRREPGTPRLLVPLLGVSLRADGGALFARFDALLAAQPRPPSFEIVARLHARDGDERWTALRSRPARRAGGRWVLEAVLEEGARVSATVSALRLDLLRFAGEELELGSLSLQEGAVPPPRGFFSFAAAHEVRTVWSGGHGEELVLSAPATGGGIVVGEAAVLGPVGRRPVRVEVEVAAAGSVKRGSFTLGAAAGAVSWTRYDVPLPSSEGTVTVRLKAPASARVLWTEPVVAPARPGLGLVLVSIDTLRADAVFPAQGRPSMPRLAARARRAGQVVLNHYAASSWTLPSHASMLTGLYPSSHAAREMFGTLELGSRRYLPLELARHGFYSAALVDGGFVSSRYGFSRGFDVFAEAPPEVRRLDWHRAEYRRLLPRLRSSDAFLFLHTYFVHDYFQVDAGAVPLPAMTPELAAYLHDQRETFLFQFDALVHGRQTRFDPRMLRLLRDLYAHRAEILDVWLDGFLDEIERDFPDRPPTVVVTSDHGERFYEGWEPRGWSHGGRPDEAVLRVPLVVLHPDRRPRPDVKRLTNGVDLVPTLLGLVGLPVQDGSGDGRDMFEPGVPEREVYSENFTSGSNHWAAISRTAKLVATVDLDRSGPARPATLLFRGRAGVVDESTPRRPPAHQAKLVERRRLGYLQRHVDGLFVRVSNGGLREGEVEIALDFDEERRPDLRALFRAGKAPLDIHLLEPEDSVTIDEATCTVRLTLRLAPGDADLVVVPDMFPFVLSESGAKAYEHRQGTPARWNGALRLDRRQATPAPPPDPPTERAPVVEVWENRPRGGAPGAKPEPMTSELKERLRALGYIQ